MLPLHFVSKFILQRHCKTFQRYENMIDYLKLSIYCTSLIQDLEQNTLLEWVKKEEKINLFDLEVIKTKTVKQYKGIYFCFYSNSLDILFKPHYYFNNNLHNANDFKTIDCINVIKDFKNTFKIDLTLLKVVNIEFGLNVISPIDIKELITFLVYHGRNEFRNDTGLAYSKKSYSTKKNGTANEYKIIKAYAKGLQFPQYTHINTFRFEVKSKRSAYINSQLEIYTANDLLNIEVYTKMIETLITEFNEVLILDCTTNFETLNTKEFVKVQKYLNAFLWYKFINQSRNSFSKNKNIYHKLIDKVENNLKSQLAKIIFNKLEILKEGAIFTPATKVKEGAISSIYKGRICTQNKSNIDEVENSICKITGLNISMQKDSILLSHTGLRYYFENDRKLFEQIKQKHLPKLWINADFETIIKELAHNIRNTSSNREIRQDRIYPSLQSNFLGQFGI